MEWTLDQALAEMKRLERPPKYAFKNSMTKIAALIRSGKTSVRSTGKTWSLRISAKKGFQTYQSMAGVKMKPLSSKHKIWKVGDDGKRVRVDAGYRNDKDVNCPLYRPWETVYRGKISTRTYPPVTTLFKLYTKKGFRDGHGGYHLEIIRADPPEMVFGARGFLAWAHDAGANRTVTGSVFRKTINVRTPPRPVLAVTAELADAAANIIADERMALIEKGFR